MLLSEGTSRASLLSLAMSMVGTATRLQVMNGKPPDVMDVVWMGLSRQVIERLEAVIGTGARPKLPDGLERDAFDATIIRLRELIASAAV